MSETASTKDLIALPERRSNRPITVLHRFEHAAVILLFGLFRLIGVDAASALAGGFMRMVGPRIHSVSKRAHKNLDAVFSDYGKAERDTIVRDVWENLGRTAAEMAHLERFRVDGNTPRIKFDGKEHLAPVFDGKPVIFVSGHFANWEVMSIALHQLGSITALSIVQPIIRLLTK